MFNRLRKTLYLTISYFLELYLIFVFLVIISVISAYCSIPTVLSVLLFYCSLFYYFIGRVTLLLFHQIYYVLPQ